MAQLELFDGVELRRKCLACEKVYHEKEKSDIGYCEYCRDGLMGLVSGSHVGEHSRGEFDWVANDWATDPTSDSSYVSSGSTTTTTAWYAFNTWSD